MDNPLVTESRPSIWRRRPTRFNFSIGDEIEGSIQALIQTCYDSRTVLGEVGDANTESPQQLAATASTGPPTTDATASPLSQVAADEGPVCVWGQYMEAEEPTDPFTQHGIYGTCAAVQVLSLRSRDNSMAVIDRALTTLPGLEAGGHDSNRATAIRDRYVGKGDTHTTYKAAALLDVALGLTLGDRDVVPPRARDGVSKPSLPVAGMAKRLFDMRSPAGGWADYSPENRLPLQPNPHATAVAILSLSRCSAAELTEAAGPGVSVWAELELTWLYLRRLDFRKQSVSTLSMILAALENVRRVLPSASRVTGSDYSRALAACRHEVSRWIRFTSSRECLRSLEALDYRSLEMEGNGKAKRYQFLYYLPHLLAAIAVMSSRSLLCRTGNRQFVTHVVEQFNRAAQDTRGEVVPGGRQRVSAVETMWVARLLDTFSARYVFERRTGLRRAWVWVRELWDTFMNPRVVPVVFAIVTAAVAATVVWKIATPPDQSAQFWWTLFATSMVSLVSAVAFGWIVSQKQQI